MPPANYVDEWRENVPPPLNGRRYIPSKKDICKLNYVAGCGCREEHQLELWFEQVTRVIQDIQVIQGIFSLLPTRQPIMHYRLVVHGFISD